MKVKQMENDRGVSVKNQFILQEYGRGANGNFIEKICFQSYDSIIVEKIVWNDRTDIKLDENYWDYSRTTSKYRGQFLGENTAETRSKIKSGEYILADLNK